jgi:hypothetical protein
LIHFHPFKEIDVNTTVQPDTDQAINDLIAPRQATFTLPEGIVAEGTDLVPTVQYLM